ncbi:hypothetical protein TIFTF001_041527 [Ficus carica]|uniref:DUF8039 domain-containing protein n=1 Tax=Ficus carica TaxID=3494 RepID=A0AA87ZFU7_FICCA|nr:hypothetical protein TIFTF001_041527 [Ficus carica]
MTPPSILSRASPPLPHLQSQPPSLHSLSPLPLSLSPPISAGRDSTIHSLSHLSLSLSPPIATATPPSNLFLETHCPLPTPLPSRPHPCPCTWAYIDCVPTNTVHGIPLGEENVRVTITILKLKCALLPILTNEVTIIEEAIGGFVVWPKRLIAIETRLSHASRSPSHVPD